MTGTAFAGSAECLNGQEDYLTFNPLMKLWAEKGSVAVNIEYHGYKNGLYGDLTFPKNQPWGTVADGTTELDIKPAISHFLTYDATRFHADPKLGIVLFGSSSGAHNAYMLAATGIKNYKLSAVVGYSGLPDAGLAGSYPESVFDTYLQTYPGSNVEHFADPFTRLSNSSPPEYVANSRYEFINPDSAIAYYNKCIRLKINACYPRIINSNQHGSAYASHVLSTQDMCIPPASYTTVINDSIVFASKFVKF